MKANTRQPREQSKLSRVGEARASDGGPPRSLAPAPSASKGWFRAESVAAWLKLASALCALGAVGLFVRPLLLGELSTQSKPRMITIQPIFSKPEGSTSEPVASASESEEPEASAPAPEGKTPHEVPSNSVTREERAEFDGAILMVESEPSGATIRVNGNDQGETPVSVGLDCLPGVPVQVEFSKRGYERAKHTALCPKDAMLKLTARLRKAPKESRRK